MVKCDICKEKIEVTFLGKIKGAYINVKGRLKAICPDCQKKYTKEEAIKKL
ncbi:MAG: hypothetical protein AB1571_01900 [Nanoarchaeota archaeon]